MDVIDNLREAAEEVVSFGRREGVDLEPFLVDGSFLKEKRFINLWRKDRLPWSGPANEAVGTLHYNLQGAIEVLPYRLKESESAFRGTWGEAGTFDNIDQAFALVKAWLLDKKEVDDLPHRNVRSYGI